MTTRARAGRPRTRTPLARRSLVMALTAYVLVGAFIGVAAWKLTETVAEAPPAQVAGTTTAAVADAGAVPAEARPSGPYRDTALADLLQRQAPANGVVGLYVKNLTTGAQASVNADRVFAAASLYKLPIMAEVIRQIRLGYINPDRQLTVTREHWVPGSGVLQGRVGDSLPVKELLRLMIAESDNIAAMMLGDLVGLVNVNQTMLNLGLPSTHVLDYRANGAYDGLGPYTTSPADMGRLMDTIASGQLVDASGSDEALHLMSEKQKSDLIGEGLPWWVKVAHKWGEIPGARHEAGIVLTPRYQYVVVIMTEDVNPQGSPAYIRDLSRTIFDYFEAQQAS
ncbi:MAG: serine hydrolase [Chloroflexi bacterium]|nr:serine hydrolase [Chloroflexota bacterium]